MDRKLKVLIVDDEELARIGLRLMLEAYTDVQIVAEAYNLKTAKEAINSFNPDVVFLDIEFPGESGFDLLPSIELSTKVVFVTAFDEHAIRAFEVNACDYLLKPLSAERLAKTMERLNEKKATDKEPQKIFNTDDSIYIQLNSKYHFFRVDSIIKITSCDQYTELICSTGIKGLSSKHLFEWKACLPASLFIQVHRSVIVNMSYIEKIEKRSPYLFQMKLKSILEPVPISRKHLRQIKLQHAS